MDCESVFVVFRSAGSFACVVENPQDDNHLLPFVFIISFAP